MNQFYKSYFRIILFKDNLFSLTYSNCNDSDLLFKLLEKCISSLTGLSVNLTLNKMTVSAYGDN